MAIILIFILLIFVFINREKFRKKLEKTQPLNMDFICKYLDDSGTHIYNKDSGYNGIKKGSGPWVFIHLVNINKGSLVIFYDWRNGDNYRADFKNEYINESIDITEDQFVFLVNKTTGLNLNEFRNYTYYDIRDEIRANQGVNLLGQPLFF